MDASDISSSRARAGDDKAALAAASPGWTWRREIIAGLTAACASLPICLATGLLVFGPLGQSYYAAGITASLYGLLVGGTVAALVGRSSFVISSPRASMALVQASLLASASAGAALAHEPLMVLGASAVCVLLAGLWQLLFGAMGMARIIKFTPHPVLAGFIDGIALLLIASQLKSYTGRPLALMFVVGIAGFMLWFGRWSKRVPAGVAGLIAGMALYHVVLRLFPGADIGSVLGAFSLPIPPDPPLAGLLDADIRGALKSVLGPVLLTSLALAVVGTLEALLMLRAAQNLVPGTVHSSRALFAQGLGNCASALAGGMSITASPIQSFSGYRAGGRTRLVALTTIASIAALVFAGPAVIAAMPVVVLSALLVATGVLLFDRWSVRLLHEALGGAPSPRRKRARSDLAVVALVMLLTAAVSVVAGIVAGTLLAGLTFIVNMSRPVIRRQRSCEVLASKRVRPAADAEFLRGSGALAQVLELEGVLFFGNADDLSEAVRKLSSRCDSILLDLRGISDIDASGANILQSTVQTTRAAGKHLLFCNVPPAHQDLIGTLAADGPYPQVFPDLDSALEWMEERALEAHAGERAGREALTLWQHPLLEGVEGADREALAPHLVQRRFAAGAMLCREGERAECMWLLTRGSVSVRVPGAAGGTMRVASCAAGTAIGEMALLEFGTRSASAVADEDVEAYELSREAFDWLSKARPEAAARLLRNIATELARRLRDRTDDLRHAQA